MARRFGWQDGRFSPGGVPIEQIADEFGTPFYLYQGEIVVEQLRRVREALGEDVEIAYSLKANPSLAIGQILASEGAGAEIASAGELILAHAAGFRAEDTVFAGPGKTDDELRLAVEHGIAAVNAESLGEIERLAAIAQAAGRRIGVSLRVNPDAQLMGSRMRMGGLASQFGIDQADLPAGVRAAQTHPSLIFRGIHIYTATQVFDVDPLLAHMRAALDVALEAADLAGGPLEVVDLGGGFGVPYFANMVEFDLERFGAGFRELLAEYRQDPRLAQSRVIIELGRYLVAEAGVYVTRVVDVKQSKGKTFAVADGGMNHHITATGNWGQVFRKAYPMLNLSADAAELADPIAVVGPCCTPLDVFGTDVAVAEPERGDLIGVFASGAYGFSASSLRFLSHPTPAEILTWQGQAHLIRPHGRPEDVLAGQRGVLGE